MPEICGIFLNKDGSGYERRVLRRISRRELSRMADPYKGGIDNVRNYICEIRKKHPYAKTLFIKVSDIRRLSGSSCHVEIENPHYIVRGI